MQYYISPPPMNPLSRLLAGVLAVLALAGAFFFGVFVLVFALSLGFVAWLFLWIRMWWMRRKGIRPVDQKGEIIDAEYTVISQKDEE
jgi:hypothetical protein